MSAAWNSDFRIHKVLSEHGPAKTVCSTVSGRLSSMIAELLSGCLRDHLARRAWNSYCLAPFRQSLPASGLKYSTVLCVPACWWQGRKRVGCWADSGQIQVLGWPLPVSGRRCPDCILWWCVSLASTSVPVWGADSSECYMHKLGCLNVRIRTG